MNTYSIVITACIVMSSVINLHAQSSLEVTVDNIKETIGSVRIGLFTNEADFLKKPADGKIVKASSNTVTVVFENLKPGEYAVSVIHDENENGELDTNLIGIPKEGFGFGNNAMGTFGPPSFKDARITLEKSAKQVISLKHF